MPLLFKVRLPKKNKIILGLIFCIGTFTIVAAALNKYYSFTHPFGNEWTIWYLRESYTAILCANLPLTWPVLQRVFKLKSWSHNSYGTSGRYGNPSRTRTHGGTLSVFKSGAPKTRLESTSTSQNKSLRRTESQERIHWGATAPGLKIYQNTEITVESTKAGSDELGLELGDLSDKNISRVSIETKESASSGSLSGSKSERQGVTATCQAVYTALFLVSSQS